jgi:polyferredoxin
MSRANNLQAARTDLTRLEFVKSALRSRWPQLILRLITLSVFLLAILAGLWGTPVGSHNFAIVFVWIAWWGLLILLAVPLFGRGWCSICPVPLPGEWLQQGALLKPQGGGLGLGKRWPKPLRNIWLQNGAFVLLALFSMVVLTQPGITALVLLAFFLIATTTSLVFERRSFCRYACPVGGFIGLYSQAAPLELRVKDTRICSVHTDKTCYAGNEDGYGCPWQVYPAGLQKNNACGLCMECLRTCPYDNIALNLRRPGADLEQPGGRKLDEAFKAFIMLGSALVYSAVMLGPWGGLKNAAYHIGSLGWIAYALGILSFVFILIPGAFALVVASGHLLAGRQARFNRTDFVQFAYALVPLGLAAWIAFSLSFVFTNLSYLWPVVSDPIGLGWNLFGSSKGTWTPYLTGLIPLLQAITLIGGAAWAARLALRIAGQIQDKNNSSDSASTPRMAWPVILYCLVVTVGLMGLMIA